MSLEGKHAPDRWGRVLRESLGRYRLVWLAILAGLVLLLLPSGRDRETPAAQPATASRASAELTSAAFAAKCANVQAANAARTDKCLAFIVVAPFAPMPNWILVLDAGRSPFIS